MPTTSYTAAHAGNDDLMSPGSNYREREGEKKLLLGLTDKVSIEATMYFSIQPWIPLTCIVGFNDIIHTSLWSVLLLSRSQIHLEVHTKQLTSTTFPFRQAKGLASYYWIHKKTAWHNAKNSDVVLFVCTLKCWFVKQVNVSVNPCGRLQINSFVALADSQHWTGLEHLKKHLPVQKR